MTKTFNFEALLKIKKKLKYLQAKIGGNRRNFSEIYYKYEVTSCFSVEISKQPDSKMLK